MAQAPGAKRWMELAIHTPQNEGVFTAFDTVGLECCQQGQSRGIVYLARGGCVVAECQDCERLWRFLDLQTHETGPLVSTTDNPNQLDRQT